MAVSLEDARPKLLDGNMASFHPRSSEKYRPRCLDAMAAGNSEVDQFSADTFTRRLAR